jgi:nitronate monooxygenase
VLRTWLTERFGLEVPVLNAPMAKFADGAFAAAVSSAGGLGMIGVTGEWDLEEWRRQISVAAASGRAFGVGVLVWALEPGDEVYVDAALEGGAAIVSLSYGDYAPLVARVHDAGAVCSTQVGTVDQAKAAADAGVDVVVARGAEGGGHGAGVMATLPLLQGVLDAIDVPVLAAGGIATARGLAAVLAAGAAGAWMGTAFLACEEMTLAEDYVAALLEAGDGSTVHTTAFDIGRGIDWPREFGGRAVRNAFSDRWVGHEDDLRSDGARLDAAPFWAGEGVSLMNGTTTVARLMTELAGAEHLLRRATSGDG